MQLSVDEGAKGLRSLNMTFPPQDTWWPVSPEFLNYGVALTVYAVRYAAVFWNTNKGLAFVFSLQLFANAMQVSLHLGGLFHNPSENLTSG